VLTLAVVPASQAADGALAANAFWMPAVGIAGLDGFTFGRVPEGEVINPYNVRFTAARRETDQAGAAIPARNRIGFWGPPETLGLSWSLPALV